MYVAIKGKAYVTTDLMYIAAKNLLVAKICCFLKTSPFYVRKIPLFVLPVMPDVLDIVIVLQHIDELLHILQVALIGEGDVVLGLLLQWFQQFFSSPELRFFAHEPKL